jgi:hypothetical protein
MEGFCSWTSFSNIEIDGRITDIDSGTALCGIGGSNTNCAFNNCRVCYCINNYELYTKEGYTLNLTDCFSYGAQRVGFQLVTSNTNHHISCVNCYSNRDGTNDSYADDLRVGFYLYGRGSFRLTGCAVGAEVASTRYAIRADSIDPSMNITLINNNFSDCTIANRLIGAGTPIEIWKYNKGFVTEKSGASLGTGSQQTIAHGLAFTPTAQQIGLFSGSAIANPYHSAAPDATNIYVTAGIGQAWYWATVGS